MLDLKGHRITDGLRDESRDIAGLEIHALKSGENL
jgi:hypothetical protein